MFPKLRIQADHVAKMLSIQAQKNGYKECNGQNQSFLKARPRP